MFNGVYELNNPKHVNNNTANFGEPTNLYEKIHELRQERRGKKFANHAVAAKDPFPLVDWKKQRAANPNKAMIENQQNTDKELADVTDRALFKQFKRMMGQQIRGEIVLKEPTNA